MGGELAVAARKGLAVSFALTLNASLRVEPSSYIAGMVSTRPGLRRS